MIFLRVFYYSLEFDQMRGLRQELEAQDVLEEPVPPATPSSMAFSEQDPAFEQTGTNTSTLEVGAASQEDGR